MWRLVLVAHEGPPHGRAGAIANTLNARGIGKARGGEWHASTVRGILLRHQAT